MARRTNAFRRARMRARVYAILALSCLFSAACGSAGNLPSPQAPQDSDRCVVVTAAEDFTARGIVATFGADSLPFLFSLEGASLNAVHCEDAACSHVTRRRIAGDVDPVSVSFLALSGELPVAMFARLPRPASPATGRKYDLVRCRDVRCAGRETDVITVERAESASLGGLLGASIIVVTDSRNVCDSRRRLKFRECSERGCGRSFGRQLEFDISSDVLAAVTRSGLALVASHDGFLEEYRCAPRDCDVSRKPFPIAAESVRIAAMLAQPTRNWIVARSDSRRLTLFRCEPTGCKTIDLNGVGPEHDDAQLLGLRADSNERPVLFLHEPQSRSVSIATCESPGCDSLRLHKVVSGAPIAVTMTGDGNPVLVIATDEPSRVQLIECKDSGCLAVNSATIDLDDQAGGGVRQ